MSSPINNDTQEKVGKPKRDREKAGKQKKTGENEGKPKEAGENEETEEQDDVGKFLITKDPKSKKDEEKGEEMPKEWKEREQEIIELAKLGFKPVKKTRKWGDITRDYFVLQKGSITKGRMGEWSEENMRKLLHFFPQFDEYIEKKEEAKQEQMESASEPAGPSTSTLTRVSIAKPEPLRSSMNLNLNTLAWYQWSQKRLDFHGSIGDFVNEVVNDYFMKEGFSLEVVKVNEKGEVLLDVA